MNKTELLSPAGDLQIFKAVIDAGADAVYFGGDMFSARSFAKNLSKEDAAEAIRYAHIRGKKAYLAVNTILKNTEVEKNLYNYILPYAKNGLDAVIVADMGVWDMIKYHFPSVEIHASTQMTLANSYGANWMYENGATRVVLARELSLKEISKIHNECPQVQIEAFCHGALCVCYSGQCLMSSLIGKRSGNRGSCAQPCRLNYELLDESLNKIHTNGQYLLSPKDFCTIEYLDKMISAGVYSFKIEGRMKSLKYAAGVTAIYRKYLDLATTFDKKYQVEEKDISKLYSLGNRSGFTSSYLFEHNDKDMITYSSSNHSSTDVEDEIINKSTVKLNALLEAKIGKPITLTIDNYTIEGPIVEKAKNNPTPSADIVDKINQTGDTDFSFKNIDVVLDNNAFVPASVVKKLRRELLSIISDNLLNTDSSVEINQYTKSDIVKDTINPVFTNSERPYLLATVSTKTQYDIAKNSDYVDAIAYDVTKDFAHGNSDKTIIGIMPIVIRKDFDFLPSDFNYIIACSFDALDLLEQKGYPRSHIILDSRIYTYSDRAISYFTNQGYIYNTVPYELNLKEIEQRDNSHSFMPLYGYIPLMVTANCQNKNNRNCNHSNDNLFLKDRLNNNFRVKCNCDNCYNIIYNCKPYYGFSERDSLQKSNIMAYRIDFTCEDEDTINKVLDSYVSSFINKNDFEVDNSMTKGHLKRGV